MKKNEIGHDPSDVGKEFIGGFDTGTGMDRNIIEENMNGCYRLRISPDRIEIERATRA